MSLHDAISYARAHQPSLAAARARVDVAREAAKLPRAQRETPQIVVGAEVGIGTNNNTTAMYGPLDFIIPRVGGTTAYVDESWKPYASTLVGGGLVQQVYDFGRLAAQAEALDLFASAAQEGALLADLDLTLLVEESFYAVAGAHAVLRAAEAAVARSTSHRDLAKAGVDAQLRPPVDLSRAEADLARFEVERVRAQGALTAAQAVLAAAIGAPDPGVDSGTDDVLYPTAPPLDVMMRDLDQKDPSLRAAHDALEGQRRTTRSIEREHWPDFIFSAGITGRAGGATVDATGTSNPPGGGFVPSVPNWDALLMVSVPIFDRTIDVRAEMSRRTERVRSAELDADRERLRGLATQIYVDLQLAESALPALQRSLEAARANEDQLDARFKAGVSTAVELADAEALLTGAEIQLAIGQFQLASARARLARANAQLVR